MLWSRDPLKFSKGCVYCMLTLQEGGGGNSWLPAFSEKNPKLQKRAFWEQRRRSFHLKGGPTGPRGWAEGEESMWAHLVFFVALGSFSLKLPPGVKDDAWGGKKGFSIE